MNADEKIDAHTIKNEEQARRAGYTVEYIATSSQHDLNILVKTDTDLDSKFLAFDPDTNEWLTVYGWLFEFEKV